MKADTFSTCDRNMAILFIPEALRSTEEQQTLEQHLLTCDTCRERSERLTGAIGAFRVAPGPPVPPTLAEAILARVSRDAVKPEADARGAPGRVPDAPRGGVWSGRSVRGDWWRTLKTWIRNLGLPLTVLVPAGAAVALLVIVLPVGHQDTGVREKSRGAASIRPSIDLQATVETLQPDGSTQLIRAKDGMTVGPDDGLLFQFAVEGVSKLSLVECDPLHEFHILFDQTVIPDASEGIVPLTSPTGRLLRYTPDGPPGEYVYLAVASPEPFTWNAELLDAVWNHYIDRLLEPLSTDRNSALAIDAIRLQFRVGPSDPGQGAQQQGQ